MLGSETAQGAALFLAAVVALGWANSPWGGSYRSLWTTQLSVGLGRFVLVEDLRHWVNDGLMTLFFFVVGLEIKRELVAGDLRDRRTAALPAIAAVGGMVVPVALFLAVTAGSGGSRGWGIPMATDIAFAVGVIALVGRRAPPSVRLFVLTLAIVDDIGAIAVIAVFYARGIRPGFLLAALLLVAVMLGLRHAGVTRAAPYVVLGIGVWLAVHSSGVHATIAGVVLGLLAPAHVSPTGDGSAEEVGRRPPHRASPVTVSPAERMERAMQPWTSFGVVPLFALANAGVAIDGGPFTAPGAVAVATGVAVALVAGKAVGILGGSWLAVRTGLGRLPEGAAWPVVGALSLLGGIGFTVSLFIADLAFEPGGVQDAAKIGILGASMLAAGLGACALVLAGRGRRPAGDPAT